MTHPFFLGQARAGAEPTGWWDLARHDVMPVAIAYLLFLVLLATHRHTARSPKPPTLPPPRSAGPGSGGLLRYLRGTFAGGYVVFLVIVVVFYVLLGGERPVFIGHALAGAAWLGFGMVLPAFLLLSFMNDRRSRRKAARQPH